MKLVIDIDKQTFDKLTEYGEPLSAGNGFHDSILKSVANGKPIEALKEERPQGEWNYIQAGMCVCPFCGAMPHKLYKNFCANCGAKMKGDAE